MRVKWKTVRDDDDFIEMCHLGGTAYLFIRIQRCEGDLYADVSFVDTEIVGKKAEDMGVDCEDIMDAELACVMCEYGHMAPMCPSITGGNRRVLHREARREARLCMDDMERRLGLPVNAIGSTALEYMRGDITSAIDRMKDGRPPGAVLVRVKTKTSDRPSDWLPFLMGYTRGKSGATNDADKTYSSQYTHGYKCGRDVLTGKGKKPEWIIEEV